ncbi:PQQ-dependent sugar dehydrogenase [Flagellimonas sp. 2504JD4-2]
MIAKKQIASLNAVKLFFFEKSNFYGLRLCLIVIIGLFSCRNSGDRKIGDEKASIKIDTIAENLVIPWDIGFASDGRVFITERPGRIRVIIDGELREEPWAQLPVANWQAAGLSGMALSPDFENNGFLYVLGTFRKGRDGFVNRVYRFTDDKNQGVDSTLIVADLPSISTHSGGALDFGPDGKLYVAMGDNENISLVQKLDNTTGKILRYNPDGSIPVDNPFPGSPVYAFGLRNPQGFAWDAKSKEMYATEHGPSGFESESYREHQDELNIIVKGGNYGWPIVSGMHMDERFYKPLVEWTPAIAPSGLCIVNNENSPWFGDLLVGALYGQHLRRIRLHRDNGTVSVENEERLFENELGRIRMVEEGPDGAIYFTTSNIDTPGEPKRRISQKNDDRLFRLTVPN